MGRRPRAAAISGVMRHGTLAYRAGTCVGRDVVGSSGRATVARPAGDGAGAARAASRRGASWPDASRKGAACGSHVAQTAPFGHVAGRGAWGTTPRQPAGHYGKWPNWANALEQPPARLRGGLRQGPQASAWSLTARKGTVWAEGLADGTPWARPGHYQAVSCGLRRCRELRVRRNPLGVEHVPELGDQQEACGGTVPVAADHRREATIRKLLSAPFALTRPTCGHTYPQAPPARRAYPAR